MNNDVKVKTAPEGQVQGQLGKRPKFEIRADGARGQIFMNGVDITNGIFGYKVVHNAGCAPVLSLDFNALDLTLSGDFLPQLPEPWNEHYELVFRDDGNSDKNVQE